MEARKSNGYICNFRTTRGISGDFASTALYNVVSAMRHLTDIQESYWEHLFFAVSVAFVLVVHGLFPWVWVMKASDMMDLKTVERREKFRRGHDEL